MPVLHAVPNLVHTCHTRVCKPAWPLQLPVHPMHIQTTDIDRAVSAQLRSDLTWMHQLQNQVIKSMLAEAKRCHRPPGDEDRGGHGTSELALVPSAAGQGGEEAGLMQEVGALRGLLARVAPQLEELAGVKQQMAQILSVLQPVENTTHPLAFLVSLHCIR